MFISVLLLIVTNVPPAPPASFSALEAEKADPVKAEIFVEEGVTAVAVHSGVFLKGKVEVPRRGVYSLWVKVRFGGFSSLRMTLEGPGGGRTILSVDRRGPNVSSTDRWIFTSGPWSGGNRVHLQAGAYAFSLEGVKRREILGPRRGKTPRAALDFFALSTFLEEIRPLLDTYDRHIVETARLEERFGDFARCRRYRGEGFGDFPSRIEQVRKDLLSLRRKFVRLFDLHEKACGRNEPALLNDPTKTLLAEIAAARARAAELAAALEKNLSSCSPAAGLPSGGFLLSIDDTEGGGPYPAGSPKWRVPHDLNVDLVALLAVGRYPSGVELPDGSMRFGPIDDAIGNVAKEGFRTLLFVDPYPPRHVVKKYGPSVRGLRPRERAGWGWINIWHPAALSWLHAYLRKYASHFANDERVFGYGFHNEPRCALGIGKEVRNAFHEYLKKAHRDLETITLDREVMKIRDSLIPRYSEIIYNGFWFSPEMEFLQKTMDVSQERVNGVVRLKLYKGNCIPVGRKSDQSLYQESFATFEEDEVYTQADAGGFIRLNALRMTMQALGKK